MEPRFFKRGNDLGNVTAATGEVCFNGTTFFQTWKSICGSWNWPTCFSLQWNHVFSNVEIIEPPPIKFKPDELQWNHVFSNVEILRVGRNGCNAEHVLQWNHVFSNVEMTPQICLIRFTVFSLQWNHVFSNVEIRSRDCYGKFCSVASMEPRFFKRGNTRRRKILRNATRASMEPRFFKRGNAGEKFIVGHSETGFNGTTFFQTWKYLLS